MNDTLSRFLKSLHAQSPIVLGIMGSLFVALIASVVIFIHSSTQKPGSFAAPVNVIAKINNGQVTLSWSVTTDPKHKVVTYIIYRNGVEVGTTSTTTYVDTSAVRRTIYSYYVIAKDSSGKLSSQSKIVSIQTPANIRSGPISATKTTTSPAGSSTTTPTSSSGGSGSKSGGSSGGGSVPASGGSNTTTATLPSGVSLQQVDGGPSYFSKWSNGFPGSSNFVPIGVYPSESLPSSLAAEGINFFTPMRNEQAGTWCPVWSNPNGNDMTGVDAVSGFYAGGSFYSPSWGSRAAFNVFGDELDGNSSNWFDCLPSNITSNNQAGSWGGLTATAFKAAEAASHSDDSTRPTYIQTTVTFMDGGANYFYSTADKQAICSGADIFSFDIYPLVLRGGNVWDMYDQVKEARGYCQDNRPVMAFTEMDHMNGGSIYPLPSQTTAEVWNAIIAGERGVEYFDQYANIDNSSYTGAGNYAAGAMYSAIKATDSEINSLAPVINAPFANGYVSNTGTMSVMAKYYNNHFYIFAIPHTSGSQGIRFTLAGAPNTTVSVINEGRTLPVSNGVFSDTFSNENTVHIYEIN